MIEKLQNIPNRQRIIAIIVIIIFATSTIEIIYEFAEGETIADMTDDLIRFILSAIVLTFFLIEYLIQQRALQTLRNKTNTKQGHLSEFDHSSLEIGNQYRAIMQKQLDAWALTDSEQDVVIMLLKGLSFKEIAGLRDTREKTVRQQASSVYRKANVSTRNELAAWFLDDLLEPKIE